MIKTAKEDWNYKEKPYKGEADREKKRKKCQQKLQRRIFGFCLFTFLLGVLCGKLVFAKEKETDNVRISEKEDSMSRFFLDTEDAQQDGKELSLEDTVSRSSGDSEEEDDTWKLVLVNAWTPMEEGYKPSLAEIENNYYFDSRAVEYLQQMLEDGRKEGLDFWICSAYRTIEKQTRLYENKVSRLMAEDGLSESQAREKAGTEVAYPGTSEHNLGLAVDIVAKDYQILDEKQARTEEAKWLSENCWRYGFILRYPLDKTEETGIIFEPWHYRYVGKEAAKEIMEQGICLEEYLKGSM